MAEERFELSSGALRTTLEDVLGGDESELSMLETEALGTAQAAIARLDDMRAMLGLAARAGGAIWMLAESRGAAIEASIEGTTATRFTGEIDASHLTGFRWLRSFWIATVARDQRTRAVLQQCTADLVGPRRHTQTFELRFIEAIRADLRGESAAEPIAAALAAIEASQLDEDWLDGIDRPRIELAAAVFARDAARADKALEHAFEAHRRYWSRASKADNDSGWFSVSLAALAVIAHDAGLVLTTTSDYAPEPLLTSYRS